MCLLFLINIVGTKWEHFLGPMCASAPTPSLVVKKCPAGIPAGHIIRYIHSATAFSISSTSLLGFMSSAIAIRQMVSKLGCFVPFSIMVRWVRAIPAKPLSTSCVNPFCIRLLRMILPTTALSNCMKSPSFVKRIAYFSAKRVYDDRQRRKFMILFW